MTQNSTDSQAGTSVSLPILHRICVPESRPTALAPLNMGDPVGVPEGVRLTTRYVERNGAPWFPVMGEYHFSRDLPERWEQELQKMKSGGVSIVATYLLWIIHEEVRGELRWDGHRDLRRFIEVADRVGLKVVIRIGPWAHGETRNGGFPDWLQSMPIAHRTNDPVYLGLARRWYAGIAGQVRGLFHTESNPAGPIVGIQVDNELYDQPDHLASLRELAEDVGMHCTLWMATGWGGAQLPKHTLLPVYAGYSDGFWEESTTNWPDFGVMHFTFNTVRDDLSVGADLRDRPVSTKAKTVLDVEDPWPFATCELGGGMQVAYHRRPLVDPDDIASLALTKLGSGSAWQGYYLYHGATQQIGQLSTTQESQSTGYPNDLPVRNYDFYAPVGAEGQQRQHFHQLRRQHLMLEAFGETIATYPTVLPEPESGPVRWAVRGDGRRGYLFFNNHQPAIAALGDVDCVQFEVEFAGQAVTLPSQPSTLNAGSYGAWPLRQEFGTITAVTATAQPITQIDTPHGPVVLFAATEGIDVELQLEGVDSSSISGADTRQVDGHIVARPRKDPGLGCEVRVGETTLVFLDPATANAVWRGTIDGRESVVVWAGEGWFDDAFRIVASPEERTISVYPALQDGGWNEVPGEGTVFSHYLVPGEDVVQPIDPPRFDIATVPVRTGGSIGRFSAPIDADFAALKPVKVEVPDTLFRDSERLLLRLDWVGDVIRVYAGDRLIADQFWYGRELYVDLLPYRDQIRESGLWLRAFAWSPKSGVFVDPRVRPEVSAPVLQMNGVTLNTVRSRSVR